MNSLDLIRSLQKLSEESPDPDGVEVVIEAKKGKDAPVRSIDRVDLQTLRITA